MKLATHTLRAATFRFGPSSWKDFAGGVSREWLTTNGIGGFASSTLIGANTRRHHGLLVAAFPPPMERLLLLSKVEEEIGAGRNFYQLSANQYRDSIFPAGFRFLASYAQEPFPTWLYRAGGMTLKKWIFLKYGENTAVLGYQLLDAAGPARLYLKPLAACRTHHHLIRSDSKKFEQTVFAGGVKVGGPNAFVHLSCPGGTFHPGGGWYYNFQYAREKERGLDFEEDLYCPGTFEVDLSPGEVVYFLASSEPLRDPAPSLWEKNETERRRRISSRLPGNNPDLEHLAQAADAFAAKRRRPCVIAGYPWPAGAARDTLISIPGLFLIPGRFEEAAQILENYVHRIKNGLLPESLDEMEWEELMEISRQVREETGQSAAPSKPDGVSAAVQSADAPLWLFYAVHKTFLYSGDGGLPARMMPALESIVRAYLEGTLFSIRAGEDGLLWAGKPGDPPLTWMDARVGPWMVTPRHGAAVEVNALWYNALKVMEALSPAEKKSFYSDAARRCQSAFQSKFWNPDAECLYDCLSPGGPNAAIRPNQILAAGLPFPILSREQSKKVFRCVTSRLTTPFGLRTLDPAHPDYKGAYQGDRWLRDRALHQGTVWPWLLGPYLDALINVEGEQARSKVLDLLSPVLAHLEDAGIGTISEIFWGDFPHEPCGSIAKAWSVAEVLRAYVEDGLGITPA